MHELKKCASMMYGDSPSFLRSHSERLYHKNYEGFAPSYVPSLDRKDRGTSPTRHYVIGKQVRSWYGGWTILMYVLYHVVLCCHCHRLCGSVCLSPSLSLSVYLSEVAARR